MRRSRRQQHKHEQQKRRPTTAWTSQEAAEEADEKEADEKEAAEDAAEEKWAWWGRAATTRALSGRCDRRGRRCRHGNRRASRQHAALPIWIWPDTVTGPRRRRCRRASSSCRSFPYGCYGGTGCELLDSR